MKEQVENQRSQPKGVKKWRTRVNRKNFARQAVAVLGEAAQRKGSNRQDQKREPGVGENHRGFYLSRGQVIHLVQIQIAARIESKRI